ncbi:MAG: hypothetical protein JKX84_03110 [Flavobacteriales bacterium]|nr:hypothetical protein [Flavobacteriales bacterium]
MFTATMLRSGKKLQPLRKSFIKAELKHLIPFFIGAALFSSCDKEVSKNIDQSKIWTCFELRYNQSADKTYATAVFRFGNSSGSVLTLSEPSEVMFDNEALNWNSETGYYEKEFIGIKPTGTFEWTDTEGNSYTNTVEIRDVVYDVLPDTIFKSQGDVQFMWAGNPILADEVISLTIDGSGETDTRVFYADTLGETFIRLDSLKLSQITSGAITLNLGLRYSPEMQAQTERGGKRLGLYQAFEQTIVLADSIP